MHEEMEDLFLMLGVTIMMMGCLSLVQGCGAPGEEFARSVMTEPPEHILNDAGMETPPVIYDSSLPVDFPAAPVTCDMSTDFTSYVMVRDLQTVYDKRTAIRQFMWNSTTLPTALPTVIPNTVGRFEADGTPINMEYDWWRTEEYVDQIDTLHHPQPLNQTHVMYYMHPPTSIVRTDLAVILHNGHDGNPNFMTRPTTHFLSQGIPVVQIHMPLDPPNMHDVDPLPSPSPHEWYRQHEPALAPGHPIGFFFVEPTIVAVNYLKSLGFEYIAMSGISGGGWTVAAAAAVDPRINFSYPLSGVSPRCLYPSFADYEQLHEDFVGRQDGTQEGVTNFLQLFLLGSIDPGRRQIVFYNDSVNEVSWKLVEPKERYSHAGKSVGAAVERYETGGYHDARITAPHLLGHAYSPETNEQIMRDINIGMGL